MAKNTITATGECDHNAREFLPVSCQLQICSTLPKSSRSEFQHHSFQFLPPSEIFAPENHHQHRSMIDQAMKKNAIIMELQAEDKAGVLRELIAKLEANKLVRNAGVCFHDLMERENIASTCFQDGVAMPHCRTAEVTHLAIVIGIKKDGYDFDSMDGEKTRIFILCLSPAGANGPHIECLSALGAILTRKWKYPKNP